MPGLISNHSGPHTHPEPADLHPASDQLLISALSSSPYTFLQPPPSLYAASLVLAKRYLDPLATSTNEIQLQRQQDARKKRKRGEVDEHSNQHILRLKQIHTEGFAIEQIWQQARRILAASQQEVERLLPSHVQDGTSQGQSGFLGNGAKHHEASAKSVRFEENGISDPEDLPDGDEEYYSDDGSLDEDVTMEDLDAAGDDEGEDPEAEVVDGEEIEETIIDEDEDLVMKPSDTFLPDKNGLNDGFFSIDDFNRQSEFLEQQDARGDPNDGAASDEEDIDWDTNPAALPLPSQIRDPISDSEEDGPTFGDADLNGPDISNDAASAASAPNDEDVGGNTNSIMYADFFAPPPRRASKRSARLAKTQPPAASSTLAREPSPESTLQRTISSVRRDLFSDASSDENEPTSTKDPHAQLSSHQTRTAALAAEIRRLEAAAVSKRDWTLIGEARAADRPLNSLLEEDLDFERVGKPVPVITNEVSEDIEALIKRRIIAREFDEVIRRRPGNLVTKDVRRGRVEVDDSKPQQSLAEIYEAEHLATTNPTSYVSASDAKLQKEEAAIAALWKEVSGKLDALSSWHYRPKPPSASINVVADVPTISMEDAQPTVGGEVGVGRLAPQEIYKAGEGLNKRKEVVVKGGGAVVGREEMSREDKKRRRRREKERIRKRGERVDGGKGVSKEGRVVGRKSKEKEVVGQLKKGGVKVIGKKGEVRDVEGRAVEAKGGVKGGGSYKL